MQKSINVQAGFLDSRPAIQAYRTEDADGLMPPSNLEDETADDVQPEEEPPAAQSA